MQAAQSSEGKQKKASLHEKLKEWKGLSLEEDAPEEGEESQEEGDSGEESALAEGKAQLRDFAKARKYKRLQDKGAIPSHILDMIENVSKTKEKPREFKSALINNLFEGDGKGGYKLCSNKPMFESHKEAYHRQYGKDQTKGLPRDVFLFQSFHGYEQALDAAIGRGSVQQWVEDGIEYCGYRGTLAETEKSNLDMMKLREGEKKVSQDQHSALAKSFKSLAWSFGDVEEGAQSSFSGAKPAKPKQKALAGLTKQMKELVTEAKSAHERLLGAAMKMIGKCSSLEDKKEVKTAGMDLKQWVTWNDHGLTREVQHLVSMCIVKFSKCVCDWVYGIQFPISCFSKELPEDKALTPSSFQIWFAQQCDSTAKINEKVRQFRALLKVRQQQQHLVWNAFDGKWVKPYRTLAPAVPREARGS